MTIKPVCQTGINVPSKLKNPPLVPTIDLSFQASKRLLDKMTGAFLYMEAEQTGFGYI